MARAFGICLLLLVIVPCPVEAVARNKQSVKVPESLLGVRVGSSLEEAHAALEGLGTFGGRATRDGGRKEAWTLRKTAYSSLAYQTDGRGRVKWVMGFVRPGKEIPFSKLGDVKQATRQTEAEVVWTIESPQGSYRVVANGAEGRARRVYLLALTLSTKQ